jgi:hypothetical protein
MDQDLYEADEADKFHVRLSSTGTSTSKVPSRGTHGADVDMDVLSLVCLPVLLKPIIITISSRFIFSK